MLLMYVKYVCTFLHALKNWWSLVSHAFSLSHSDNFQLEQSSDSRFATYFRFWVFEYFTAIEAWCCFGIGLSIEDDLHYKPAFQFD
jgi:hypothetical protein